MECGSSAQNPSAQFLTISFLDTLAKVIEGGASHVLIWKQCTPACLEASCHWTRPLLDGVSDCRAPEELSMGRPTECTPMDSTSCMTSKERIPIVKDNLMGHVLLSNTTFGPFRPADTLLYERRDWAIRHNIDTVALFPLSAGAAVMEVCHKQVAIPPASPQLMSAAELFCKTHRSKYCLLWQKTASGFVYAASYIHVQDSEHTGGNSCGHDYLLRTLESAGTAPFQTHLAEVWNNDLGLYKTTAPHVLHARCHATGCVNLHPVSLYHGDTTNQILSQAWYPVAKSTSVPETGWIVEIGYCIQVPLRTLRSVGCKCAQEAHSAMLAHCITLPDETAFVVKVETGRKRVLQTDVWINSQYASTLPGDIKSYLHSLDSTRTPLTVIDDFCRTLASDQKIANYHNVQVYPMVDKTIDFESNQTLGLRWKCVGSRKPSSGREIHNDTLVALLKDGPDLHSDVLLDPSLQNLSFDDYVLVGNEYMQPDAHTTLVMWNPPPCSCFKLVGLPRKADVYLFYGSIHPFLTMPPPNMTTWLTLRCEAARADSCRFWQPSPKGLKHTLTLESDGPGEDLGLRSISRITQAVSSTILDPLGAAAVARAWQTLRITAHTQKCTHTPSPPHQAGQPRCDAMPSGVLELFAQFHTDEIPLQGLDLGTFQKMVGPSPLVTCLWAVRDGHLVSTFKIRDLAFTGRLPTSIMHVKWKPFNSRHPVALALITPTGTIIERKVADFLHKTCKLDCGCSPPGLILEWLSCAHGSSSDAGRGTAVTGASMMMDDTGQMERTTKLESAEQVTAGPEEQSTDRIHEELQQDAQAHKVQDDRPHLPLETSVASLLTSVLRPLLEEWALSDTDSAWSIQQLAHSLLVCTYVEHGLPTIEETTSLQKLPGWSWIDHIWEEVCAYKLDLSPESAFQHISSKTKPRTVTVKTLRQGFAMRLHESVPLSECKNWLARSENQTDQVPLTSLLASVSSSHSPPDADDPDRPCLQTTCPLRLHHYAERLRVHKQTMQNKLQTATGPGNLARCKRLSEAAEQSSAHLDQWLKIASTSALEIRLLRTLLLCWFQRPLLALYLHFSTGLSPSTFLQNMLQQVLTAHSLRVSSAPVPALQSHRRGDPVIRIVRIRSSGNREDWDSFCRHPKIVYKIASQVDPVETGLGLIIASVAGTPVPYAYALPEGPSGISELHLTSFTPEMITLYPPCEEEHSRAGGGPTVTCADNMNDVPRGTPSRRKPEHSAAEESGNVMIPARPTTPTDYTMSPPDTITEICDSARVENGIVLRVQSKPGVTIGCLKKWLLDTDSLPDRHNTAALELLDQNGQLLHNSGELATDIVRSLHVRYSGVNEFLHLWIATNLASLPVGQQALPLVVESASTGEVLLQRIAKLLRTPPDSIAISSQRGVISTLSTLHTSLQTGDTVMVSLTLTAAADGHQEIDGKRRHHLWPAATEPIPRGDTGNNALSGHTANTDLRPTGTEMDSCPQQDSQCQTHIGTVAPNSSDTTCAVHLHQHLSRQYVKPDASARSMSGFLFCSPVTLSTRNALLQRAVFKNLQKAVHTLPVQTLHGRGLPNFGTETISSLQQAFEHQIDVETGGPDWSATLQDEDIGCTAGSVCRVIQTRTWSRASWHATGGGLTSPGHMMYGPETAQPMLPSLPPPLVPHEAAATECTPLTESSRAERITPAPEVESQKCPPGGCKTASFIQRPTAPGRALALNPGSPCPRVDFKIQISLYPQSLTVYATAPQSLTLFDLWDLLSAGPLALFPRNYADGFVKVGHSILSSPTDWSRPLPSTPFVLTWSPRLRGGGKGGSGRGKRQDHRHRRREGTGTTPTVAGDPSSPACTNDPASAMQDDHEEDACEDVATAHHRVLDLANMLAAVGSSPDQASIQLLHRQTGLPTGDISEVLGLSASASVSMTDMPGKRLEALIQGPTGSLFESILGNIAEQERAAVASEAEAYLRQVSTALRNPTLHLFRRGRLLHDTLGRPATLSHDSKDVLKLSHLHLDRESLVSTLTQAGLEPGIENSWNKSIRGFQLNSSVVEWDADGRADVVVKRTRRGLRVLEKWYTLQLPLGATTHESRDRNMSAILHIPRDKEGNANQMVLEPPDDQSADDYTYTQQLLSALGFPTEHFRHSLALCLLAHNVLSVAEIGTSERRTFSTVFRSLPEAKHRDRLYVFFDCAGKGIEDNTHSPHKAQSFKFDLEELFSRLTKTEPPRLLQNISFLLTYRRSDQTTPRECKASATVCLGINIVSPESWFRMYLAADPTMPEGAVQHASCVEKWIQRRIMALMHRLLPVNQSYLLTSDTLDVEVTSPGSTVVATGSQILIHFTTDKNNPDFTADMALVFALQLAFMIGVRPSSPMSDLLHFFYCPLMSAQSDYHQTLRSSGPPIESCSVWRVSWRGHQPATTMGGTLVHSTTRPRLLLREGSFMESSLRRPGLGLQSILPDVHLLFRRRSPQRLSIPALLKVARLASSRTRNIRELNAVRDEDHHQIMSVSVRDGTTLRTLDCLKAESQQALRMPILPPDALLLELASTLPPTDHLLSVTEVDPLMDSAKLLVGCPIPWPPVPVQQAHNSDALACLNCREIIDTGAISADLMLQHCITCLNLTLNLNLLRRTVRAREELLTKVTANQTAVSYLNGNPPTDSETKAQSAKTHALMANWPHPGLLLLAGTHEWSADTNRTESSRGRQSVHTHLLGREQALSNLRKIGEAFPDFEPHILEATKRTTLLLSAETRLIAQHLYTFQSSATDRARQNSLLCSSLVNSPQSDPSHPRSETSSPVPEEDKDLATRDGLHTEFSLTEEKTILVRPVQDRRSSKDLLPTGFVNTEDTTSSGIPSERTSNRDHPRNARKTGDARAMSVEPTPPTLPQSQVPDGAAVDTLTHPAVPPVSTTQPPPPLGGGGKR